MLFWYGQAEVNIILHRAYGAHWWPLNCRSRCAWGTYTSYHASNILLAVLALEAGLCAVGRHCSLLAIADYDGLHRHLSLAMIACMAEHAMFLYVFSTLT